MPTVLRFRGYRSFFFSFEGAEPPHIHAEHAGRFAKFWLAPVALSRSRAFRQHELTEIRRIIEEHKAFLEERWHEYFQS